MSEVLNKKYIPAETNAVVFDWDDTVVGTIDAKIQQHMYVALEHYNIELTAEQMMRDWGRPLHELIETWYRVSRENEATYQSVLETVLSYSSTFLKKPFPDALGVLEALKEEGYHLGVVTGSPRNDIYHDFAVTGITQEHFDYFQTSDDSVFHKPDPRVFSPTNTWLNSIGITPRNVLYVGDSLRDYQAAKGAGYHFLGVETAVDNSETFTQAGALSIKAIGNLLKK